MILDSLEVPRTDFEERTGWKLKSEGACKGELCVPLPQPPGDTVDVAVVAERLGMPLVRDEAHGIWALGPESIAGHAITTAEDAELVLPDVDGNEFRLSSLRGQKVLLVAWAPY